MNLLPAEKIVSVLNIFQARFPTLAVMPSIRGQTKMFSRI